MKLLDADTAKAIVNEDDIDPSEYTSISEEAAKILSNGGINYLYLSSLENISEEVAKNLSEFSGDMLDLGLSHPLSAGVAKALSLHQCAELCLSCLDEIDIQTAQTFGNRKGFILHLPALRQLSVEAAEALLTKGEIEATSASEEDGILLVLTGLERIEPILAKSLTKPFKNRRVYVDLRLSANTLMSEEVKTILCNDQITRVSWEDDEDGAKLHKYYEASQSGDLRLKNGEIYKSYKVVHITDNEICINYSNGSSMAAISRMQLPDDFDYDHWHDVLGY